jgi:hypothetical protein
MFCEFGNHMDENNCPICKCVDPCEGKCGPEEICSINRDNCKGDICDPEVTCSRRSIQRKKHSDSFKLFPYFSFLKALMPIVKCPLIGCRMFCEFGYQKNENNCPICKCVDPCEGKCGAGEFCTVQAMDCQEPPCAPMITCEAGPEPRKLLRMQKKT